MLQQILDFWFGVQGSADYRAERELWFRKDAAVDAEIRRRFGAAVESALAGGYADWTATPRGALARVLLLDQFTRNIYRDTATAFAGDTLALQTADAALARGDDAALIAVERWFLYLPYEHAESLAAQQRSLELFAKLREESGLAAPLAWAQKHAAIVRRFGRYPHRNALLGRESTTEELAFLAQTGSRF